MTSHVTSTEAIRRLLRAGRAHEIGHVLARLEPTERRVVCSPLTRQAKAVLNARFGSTVASWLGDLREDYPGGHGQFIDAWTGRLRGGHWDAATPVLLGAKTAGQAARVWPIPEDQAFARWIYPAFFPNEVAEFVARWSADFAGIFTRIFSTPGVRGASLGQIDHPSVDHPTRTVVVPGLVKAGVWNRDFVVECAQSALSGDLPAYERRWFARLAIDLGV